MSDLNRTFIELCNLLISPLLSGDGFNWVITGIGILDTGPYARFNFDWHYTRRGDVPTSSHDSFACMTLHLENGTWRLRPETCTMGKMTTDSMRALENRFTKAIRALREH